jgi:predicted amidophosphoribosyltransferase
MKIEWNQKVLIKNTASDTQTKKKRLERWENVEKVFSVMDKDMITGKRILLVDDVVTTGSTLEACAQVLIDNGCKEISIAAIASAQ